jgi:hypothetical protein
MKFEKKEKKKTKSAPALFGPGGPASLSRRPTFPLPFSFSLSR